MAFELDLNGDKTLNQILTNVYISSDLCEVSFKNKKQETFKFMMDFDFDNDNNNDDDHHGDEE